jgi:hypothetical protein
MSANLNEICFEMDKKMVFIRLGTHVSSQIRTLKFDRMSEKMIVISSGWMRMISLLKASEFVCPQDHPRKKHIQPPMF